MLQHRYVILVAAVALAIALAGCGGGGETKAPAAAPIATSVIQGEQNALPLATAAKIPSGLKCGSQDIVWVNMHSKAFHDPGDPWYGKSKIGMYMCRNTAMAQGDHPAGARRTHMGKGTNAQPNTMMNEATAAPAATRY